MEVEVGVEKSEKASQTVGLGLAVMEDGNVYGGPDVLARDGEESTASQGTSGEGVGVVLKTINHPLDHFDWGSGWFLHFGRVASGEGNCRDPTKFEKA